MKALMLLVPLLALALNGQDPVKVEDKDGLAARRLYYQDNAPEATFKATTVAPKPAEPKPPSQGKPATPQLKPQAQAKPVVANPQAPILTKAQQIEIIEQALRQAAAAALNAAGTIAKPVKNLGVQYYILKVDKETDVRTEVPTDTVFHENDCVAVRIRPNRGGFLYVFAEESSGRFRPLIPSEEAAEDSNIVRAYNPMDVPEHYCFEMDEKPGTERLLIVVTGKPEDVMKLNDMLRNGGKPVDSYVVAEKELSTITGALQGRDLKITRVGSKPAPGEAPYATYLVNAAATTEDRLVLEIKLKHGK